MPRSNFGLIFLSSWDKTFLGSAGAIYRGPILRKGHLVHLHGMDFFANPCFTDRRADVSGIRTILGPCVFSLSSDRGCCNREISIASYHSVSWRRLYNSELSSLGFVQQNSELDVTVSGPRCVSLRCLWSAHRAL